MIRSFDILCLPSNLVEIGKLILHLLRLLGSEMIQEVGRSCNDAEGIPLKSRSQK